jgi:hypothetical protein
MTTISRLKPWFGWTAILLLPLAIPLALIAGLFARPAARTPQDLLALLEEYLNGTDTGAWDELESVPIADPALEAIRRRAIPMGPPKGNEAGLRDLMAELKSRFPDLR